MENMDKGLTADKSAEITPNAPKFTCLNCLPKPKSSGFRWKKTSLSVHSLWYQVLGHLLDIVKAIFSVKLGIEQS
jgi:hypothetical protein